VQASRPAPRPVPRQAVLVVNAHSRKGRALFREAERKLRAAGIELTASQAVRDPSRMTAIVQAAVEAGAPMLIVGGGDGSLSATIDRLVDRDCVFALLPLGTANSFARTLGIPLDLDGAIDTIANGRRRRVDLGVINGEHYANCAALGLSPMIGDSVPHDLKRYLGRVGYLLWALWCLVRFRPFRLTVYQDGHEERLWATEVRIANGSFHGGVELVEEAEVDSGEIIVQAVTGRSTLRLLWNWVGKYFRLPAREAVTREFRGRKLRIETRPRQRISVDGEVLTRTPADIGVARKAVDVVVPNLPA
jgi:YegS/Rv2252/BmrU family lipid kinase